MKVSERLRIELALHGVRPTLVAQRAGLHPSQLSRILNGHQQPAPDTLRRIEAAIRAGPDRPAMELSEVRR